MARNEPGSESRIYYIGAGSGGGRYPHALFLGLLDIPGSASIARSLRHLLWLGSKNPGNCGWYLWLRHLFPLGNPQVC